MINHILRIDAIHENYSCYKRFQWAIQECMGDSMEDDEDIPLCIQSPKLSGRWYLRDAPDEDVYNCVRECVGDKPCGGRAPLYKTLYNSFKDCCTEHTWWKDCSLSSPTMQISCSDTFWDT